MAYRTRVYIAGPISRGDLQENIDKARAAAQQLIKAGFSVLCPQLTCFMESNTPTVHAGIPHEQWMENDLPWVAVSDAVVRLPGESQGADLEIAVAKELKIPVYKSVEALITKPPAKGHPKFRQLLHDAWALHVLKAQDYGSDVDLFANIRASEEIGVPAWKGAWLRARDKVKRIDSYCLKGTLANEGVIDSFVDLAAYCYIAAILHGEATELSHA